MVAFDDLGWFCLSGLVCVCVFVFVFWCAGLLIFKGFGWRTFGDFCFFNGTIGFYPWFCW